MENEELNESKSVIVHFLIVFFALGTWLGVFAVLAELPVLVGITPEKAALPAIVILIMQIGNIGPILYTVMQKYAPKKIPDVYLIYSIQFIAIIGLLLASISVQDTSNAFGGGPRSLVLYFTTFLLAINSNTSQVVCMPYIGRFKSKYLTTYMIGETVCGFLPSVLGLLQGSVEAPKCSQQNKTNQDALEPRDSLSGVNFSPEVFFLIHFLIMIVSLVSFFLLENLSFVKNEYANVIITAENEYVYTKQGENEIIDDEAERLPKLKYFLLLFLMALVGVFSVSYSVMAYSCEPFGPHAYHYATSFTIGFQPVVGFAIALYKNAKILDVYIISGVMIAFGLYASFTAVVPPHPLLVRTTIGTILIVTIWTSLQSVTLFNKNAITHILRNQGGKSLRSAGTAFLFGAALMAILIYSISNIPGVFVDSDSCA